MCLFLHLTGFCSFTMTSVSSDNIQERDPSVAITVAIPSCQAASSSFRHRNSPLQPSRERGQTPRHASPDFQPKPNASSCTCHRGLGGNHISVWVAKTATSCQPPDLTARCSCCGQWSSSCCWEWLSPAFSSPACWS